MYKKILIAYDGSAHSQRALDCAQDLAQKYGAHLVLVHAFHSIPKEWGAPFLQEAETNAMKAAEKVILEAKTKLAGTNPSPHRSPGGTAGGSDPPGGQYETLRPHRDGLTRVGRTEGGAAGQRE
jgi:nucleotide-binding universal stress UspA family protein